VVRLSLAAINGQPHICESATSATTLHTTPTGTWMRLRLRLRLQRLQRLTIAVAVGVTSNSCSMQRSL
jgi:hypothetical protein